MESIKELVTENATQLWTLVSVIIGGFVTYLTTSATEKRKNKRQDQKENLEKVLIPFCTCVEETLETVKDVYNQSRPIDIWDEECWNNWFIELRKPTNYLKASKRVYLPDSIRNKLDKYDGLLSDFEKAVDEKSDLCLTEYRKFIVSYLEKFEICPEPMWITVALNKKAETKIKASLITGKELSLIDNITGVDFVQNDDPDNYKNLSVSLNEEIKKLKGALDWGVISLESSPNSQEQLACDVLDFIQTKITEETEMLNSILAPLNCSKKYYKLTGALTDIQKGLLKSIDKITK